MPFLVGDVVQLRHNSYTTKIVNPNNYFIIVRFYTSITNTPCASIRTTECDVTPPMGIRLSRLIKVNLEPSWEV